MLAKITSGAVVGLDTLPVEVEVDISTTSLPSFNIVGLGDKAVEESRERVRSAIKNTGADFPKHRITVNLAPADLPKEGAVYDLPIAVGLLAGNDLIKEDLSDSLLLGELSLDGSLRPTPGVLPMVLHAKEKGLKRVFLPKANALEAAIVTNVEIYPVSNLKELIDHLNKLSAIAPHPPTIIDLLNTPDSMEEIDMADIKGQEHAKRAAEISAAGGHNIFLTGPPGAGKTMLARALAGILPSLTMEEALETTKIYSVVGQLPSNRPLITKRPFRSPHHTTSHVGLVGGGTHPKPGEISLAHRGVLFCDEFPEFERHTLEAMRQPLEDGFITVSRAQGTVVFPAKFILVAAANPCPCGFLGDLKHKCICSQTQIERYKKRLSGPILDRIDLRVNCTAVPPEKLTALTPGETSKTIRARVQKARDIQSERFIGTKITCNCEMSSRDVKNYCPLSSKELEFMQQMVISMGISARSYYRIIKVARTIADLEGSKDITCNHLAETMQFRFKEDR